MPLDGRGCWRPWRRREMALGQLLELHQRGSTHRRFREGLRVGASQIDRTVTLPCGVFCVLLFLSVGSRYL